MENQTVNGTLWFVNTLMTVKDIVNVTAPSQDQKKYEYDDEPRLRRINRKYITVAIISILANLIILLLIWTSKANRQKPFLWHVTSLSAWYLFFGAFIIPLSLDYQTDWFWKHGVIVCRVTVVAGFLNLSLCSLILICASVDRMLAIMQLVTRINEKLAQILNYALVIMPWLITTAVILPITLAFESDSYYTHPVPKCYLALEEKHYVNALTLLFIIPLAFLAVDMLILILFYVLKEGNVRVSRRNSEQSITEEEVVSLRMSTVSLWTGFVVLFASWLPIVSQYTLFIFNYKERSCLINYKAFSSIKAIFESSCATIPFVWLLLVEIRTSLMEWMPVIRSKICMRNKNPMGIITIGISDSDQT